MRILTHNIRYATTSPFPGEAPWPERLPGLLAQLEYHTRHDPEALICLQEVLHGQLVDIVDGLNDATAAATTTNTKTKISDPSRASISDADLTSNSPRKEAHGPGANPEKEDASRWDFYGVGRDDGQEKGEYSPVFYRPRAWRKMGEGTIWLSQTPAVPGSKGWDAASVRICTGLVLERRDGEERGNRRKGGLGGGLGCSDQKQSRGDEEEGFIIVGRSDTSDGGGTGDGGNGNQDLSMREEGWDTVADKEIEGEKVKPWDQKTRSKPNRKSNGKRILVLNTHLDDQGLISRRKSAQLILDCIPDLRARGRVDGVVLAGDLNSEATDDKYYNSSSNSTSTDAFAAAAAAAPSSSREAVTIDHDKWEEKAEEEMKDDKDMRQWQRQLAHLIRNCSDSDVRGLPPFLRQPEDGGTIRNKPSSDRGDPHLRSRKQEEDAWTILNAPGSGMRDVRSLILGSEEQDPRRYGHSMTFTGFNGRGDADKRCKRIDFIHVDTGLGTTGSDPNDSGEAKENGGGDRDGGDFGGKQRANEQDPGRERGPESEESGEKKGKEEEENTSSSSSTSSPWLIQGYAVLPNVFDDGVYISDHRAVVADIVLR